MSDNITFQYGATIYQCEINPKYDWYFTREQVIHDLANGDDKLYKKGFKFYCSLLWDKTNFFRHDQMVALNEMFEATEGITFQPFPTSNPTQTILVQWNEAKPNFQILDGVCNLGYTGSMQLTGSVTSTIPSGWEIGEL